MSDVLNSATNIATIIDLWDKYEEYLKEESRKKHNIKDETKKDWGMLGFRSTYSYLLNFESFINWLRKL